MLEILVASSPTRQRQAPSFVLSGVGHALVLGLLITAGRAVTVRPAEVREDTTLVFLPRLSPVATERLAPRGGRLAGEGGGTGGVLTISENPPARGFQTILAVTDIPTSIPPADPGARSIDPRDYTGRGVEGGTGWGVVGGVGPADQPPGEYGFSDELYEATSEVLNFRPAELVEAPVFKYPPVLAGIGMDGRVQLQFVVDTSGLVEPTSIVVLSGTHPAFVEAAKAGILEARFRPARLGPRAVRQLTRLPVKFVMVERAG